MILLINDRSKPLVCHVLIMSILCNLKFAKIKSFNRFCICAEFLGTKLSEKSNLEIPEGVRTKARVPSEICSYDNYG